MKKSIIALVTLILFSCNSKGNKPQHLPTDTTKTLVVWLAYPDTVHAHFDTMLRVARDTFSVSSDYHVVPRRDTIYFLSVTLPVDSLGKPTTDSTKARGKKQFLEQLTPDNCPHDLNDSVLYRRKK